MSEERLTAELSALLGDGDFLRLVERFGGTRLYVPASGAETLLARAVGHEAAATLAKRYAGSSIRVPLAREKRARQYRAENRSNAYIARRLGITETGVDKLFSRMSDRPLKGHDPRQADLFLTN